MHIFKIYLTINHVNICLFFYWNSMWIYMFIFTSYYYVLYKNIPLLLQKGKTWLLTKSPCWDVLIILINIIINKKLKAIIVFFSMKNKKTSPFGKKMTSPYHFLEA